MKHRAVWFLIACLLPLVAQAEYYRPLSGGYSRYKLEAVRQLVTPMMRIEAEILTTDPNLQEQAEMALALDRFVFDGLRLVRERGMLVTSGPIDDSAYGRAMIYFGVNLEEAQAWLMASRALQMSGFVPGVSLPVLETDMLGTAGDLRMRLETYFPPEVVHSLMPRFAWREPVVQPEVRTLIPPDFPGQRPIIKGHVFTDGELLYAAEQVEQAQQAKSEEVKVEVSAPEQKQAAPVVAPEAVKAESQEVAPAVEKAPAAPKIVKAKAKVAQARKDLPKDDPDSFLDMALPPISPDIFE
jgi:hypothetical protein